MDYLFYQSYSRPKLPLLERRPSGKRVLIVTHEFDLYTLYKLHLADEGYELLYSDNASGMVNQALLFEPHAVLVEITDNDHHAVYVHIAELLKHLPHLPVVTIGHQVHADSLKDLLGIGVRSHINRAITRPKDIGLIFKALLP